MVLSPLLLLALGCAPKQPTSTAAPATAAAPAAGDTWGASEPAAAPEPVAAPEPASTAPVSRLSPSASRVLTDSAAQLSTGDRARAEAALPGLLELARENPDVAEVQYNLGLAYQLKGETENARKAWSRATEIDPAFSRAWLNLGVLSARAGRMDMALATFQTGTRYNYRDIELRVATVEALRQLKRFDDAIAAGKAALGINSKAKDVYTALARVYLETDRADLAQFILEKALIEIKSAGMDAGLHAALGKVYRAKGFDGDALNEFRKALELDPYQLDALQALGSYYLDNRAFSDATPIWERVVAQVPSQVGPRINLGISYRGEQRYEDARRTYEECLRIDPRDPEPYRNLAVLYGDYLKDYDTAVSTIEQYRKAGGGPAAELDKWAETLKKEKQRRDRADERKRQDEEKKRREAEEAAKKAAEPAPAPTAPVEPAPSEPNPWPAPAPSEPAPSEPAPTGDPNPWGGGG